MLHRIYIVIFRIRRKSQHENIWVLCFNQPRRRDAVHFVHFYVHHDNSRLEGSYGRNGLVTIAPGIFNTPLMNAAPDKVKQPLIEMTQFPKRLGIPSEYAALMVMDPGHRCVRVELPEGPFYADVGYAAPIFQAYPLFESFSLDTHREKFDYSVRADGIFVTRNPGPSKKLDPTPRRLADLRDHIAAANDWSAPQSFLRRFSYAGYVDGVYTSLRDGTLTRYAPGGPEKSEVAPGDVPAALAEIFGADPALYVEPAEVRRRYDAG